MIEEVEKLVRSRLVNLHSHISRKREILSNQPVKEYVTGEGFYHLGRKYRLKLVDDGTASLRLLNGRFLLPRAMAAKGREALFAGTPSYAQQWLRERAIPLEQRVAIHPTSITVRDLGFRWGSCAESGAVNFHWRIILLPPNKSTI